MDTKKRPKKKSEKQEKIKMILKFEGTGKHKGLSLKDLFKMYPGGKIRVLKK